MKNRKDRKILLRLAGAFGANHIRILGRFARRWRLSRHLPVGEKTCPAFSLQYSLSHVHNLVENIHGSFPGCRQQRPYSATKSMFVYRDVDHEQTHYVDLDGSASCASRKAVTSFSCQDFVPRKRKRRSESRRGLELTATCKAATVNTSRPSKILYHHA
jgi:hypothetical protein